MSQPINERWRPVVGWEGRYEVSDHGRVRSLDRTVVRSDGRTMRIRGCLMSPSTGARTKHKHVNLRDDNVQHPRKVHRLVAEAFIGPIPDGMQVLHWNDIPDDNRVENLRIGTFSDNAYDKVRNGRHHNACKTHCPKGHEYSAENTYVLPSRPSARYCRACHRERTTKRENDHDKSDSQ